MTAREAWAAIRRTLDGCTDWQWERIPRRGGAFRGGKPCGKCEACAIVAVLDAHFAGVA